MGGYLKIRLVTFFQGVSQGTPVAGCVGGKILSSSSFLPSNTSMEQEPGLLSDTKAKVDVTKKYIEACFSVSGFSSKVEEEYENSLSHLHQSYLHVFEQEGLTTEEKDKHNIENVLDGVKIRVDTLRKCQRPLFQSIPEFYDLQLKEMLDHATKVIHKNLDAQISSVFLIDKSGKLSRQSLYGITNRKQIVDSKWFAEEKYSIDNQTLVGKTAVPSFAAANQASGRRFGELYYTNTTSPDITSADNRERYTEEFGPMHEVMAVPINNRNRTFGVLRIINKIDKRTQKIMKTSPFNERDFFYLSLFASEIGYALLNFERDTNRRLFSSLLKEITRPEDCDYHDKQATYIKSFLNNVLTFLVKNETLPFNFATIRFFCKEPESYNVAALAAFDPKLNESDRNNDPIPMSMHTFVGITCTKKQHIVISDISPKLTQFHNKAWIQKHGFSTFCCFPLTCRSIQEEQAYGTLSLYTGYRYIYDTKTIELLQTLSDTIATFLYVENAKAGGRDIYELLASVCDPPPPL
jgi:hypothetical protein